MAVSAATAVRAWLNAQPDLTGKGKPLHGGAFLEGQAPRSPAHGAYARLIHEPGTSASLVAEPGGPSVARITFHVFAGTIDASQAAAVAVCNAVQALAGRPAACGGTGVTILATANHAEPGYVPAPGAGGEQHEYTTGADFVLYAGLGDVLPLAAGDGLGHDRPGDAELLGQCLLSLTGRVPPPAFPDFRLGQFRERVPLAPVAGAVPHPVGAVVVLAGSPAEVLRPPVAAGSCGAVAAFHAGRAGPVECLEYQVMDEDCPGPPVAPVKLDPHVALGVGRLPENPPGAQRDGPPAGVQAADLPEVGDLVQAFPLGSGPPCLGPPVVMAGQRSLWFHLAQFTGDFVLYQP